MNKTTITSCSIITLCIVALCFTVLWAVLSVEPANIAEPIKENKWSTRYGLMVMVDTANLSFEPNLENCISPCEYAEVRIDIDDEKYLMTFEEFISSITKDYGNDNPPYDQTNLNNK